MNMQKWMDDILAMEKKPSLPILSFPSAKMMGVSVDELVNSAELQAKGIKTIYETFNTAAAQGFMNLSVEAEAFGATAIHSENEVPTIVGQLISEPEEADALNIPAIGTGQTKAILEGLKIAREQITDKPLFAECIGPFSLAGRLMNVNEIMVNCYEEPEMVHVIMRKATDFLKSYIAEFKKIGCDGVIIGEPLTGVLSPTLAREFSHPYTKELVDAAQDENFVIIYHNCGNGTVHMLDDIYALGAKGYHFGDSVSVKEILEKTPDNILVLGNVSPARVFVAGTPETVREATLKLLNECSSHRNFWISSGCDVPPQTKQENIEAYFAAIEEFYAQ